VKKKRRRRKMGIYEHIKKHLEEINQDPNVYADSKDDLPDPKSHGDLHGLLVDIVEPLVDDLFRYEYLGDPNHIDFQTAVIDELANFQFGIVVPFSLTNKYDGKRLLQTVVETTEAWKESNSKDIAARLKNLSEDSSEDLSEEEEDRKKRYAMYVSLKEEFEDSVSCKCKGNCKQS
jgi:hypothetical protein